MLERARYLAARLEFATGTFKPSNHSPVMRFAPTTQELLGVVVAEVAQAGESLGDERGGQRLGAVDFDAVAPGGIAVGDGEGHRGVFGKSEREGSGGARRA